MSNAPDEIQIRRFRHDFSIVLNNIEYKAVCWVLGIPRQEPLLSRADQIFS